MRTSLMLMFMALVVASTDLRAREPIVGLPCEGCQAVFEGLPRDIPANARLAPGDVPGTPMTVTGRVFAADGEAVAGVVVYAYQTNAEGIYPRPAVSIGSAADRHGALRGWARSDADGRYVFDTIRPGSYPTRDVPAHIHLHVIEPGCATYYIDDILFTDDPLLTPAARRRTKQRAGNGIATPVLDEGRWSVERDITLGLNIPGYPDCGQGRAGA